MTRGYRRARLADLETNPEKPGRRWEISPPLGIEAYNFNVAHLDPGTRLSQNAYHHHDDQEEFFYVIAGRCRVEAPDSSFDLGPDEMVIFRPGVDHLLHNPYDEPCRIVAIGAPPEGRRPVTSVTGYEALLAERYPDGDVAAGPASIDRPDGEIDG